MANLLIKCGTSAGTEYVKRIYKDPTCGVGVTRWEWTRIRREAFRFTLKDATIAIESHHIGFTFTTEIDQ